MSFIHCVLSFAADKIRRVRSENIRLRYIGVRSSRISAILFALSAIAMASGDGGGDSVNVNGTGGNDVLVVTATEPNGGAYSLNGGPAVTFKGATSFSFAAGAGDDLLRVIHPAGTVFAPAGGIDYDGGDDFDVLDVVGGGGASSGSYTPGDTPDSGTITHAAGGLESALVFKGIEPTTVSGMANFTFTTPGSNDVLRSTARRRARTGSPARAAGAASRLDLFRRH